ncbi:3287_t:CDS:2 [Entrophospora sp. SA101]|nr:3464_t:CDS:2 [Entrophospora sp. SA101]CAJ0758170.1 20449_t:CDS:2 [Entrophospora sp. SA101]CAJ0759966.1 3287_t:CDS:2 [Entrophospora sp. SA101]CAJ0857301.1 10755_t:CDS:2 [Entrophospora sp. SA101]CAJ0857455.1 10769_t:CDS:2 [Entrophospora sp. SA101]
MNKLPDECFLNIIEQLIKSYQDALNQCCHTRRTSNRSSNNDKNEAISNILFSCILVNRYWCRNVLPILWSKPFRFLHKPLPGLIQVLEKLSLFRTKFLTDTFKTIITASQETLKELQLCGTISDLDKNRTEENRSRLFDGISKCVKLEYLELQAFKMYLGTSEEILQNLAKVLPKSLNHLEIDFHCSSDELKSFFNNSDLLLKTIALRIGNTGLLDVRDIYIDDSHLIEIMEYKKLKKSLELLILAGKYIKISEAMEKDAKNYFSINKIVKYTKTLEVWD